MKFTIKENSENYACTVVEIKNMFDIEGADNIKRTVVEGNNVVVGKNVIVGDYMLYFVSGTKLNEDFCKFNNLYTDPLLNKDTTVKGYISPKQSRVKAIKLKGVISDGILLPISSLSFLGIPIRNLTVSTEFTTINDILVCEKYIVKTNNPGGKNKQQKKGRSSRLVDNQFYFHDDTSNLRKNVNFLKYNDTIGIHYKKHGCSFIVSNVLVKKQLAWYEKLLQKMGVKIQNTEYDIIYSSRKVIKNQYDNLAEGFYGEDIWGIVADELKEVIPKGWILYGEILGYTPNGKMIQKDFDYGCEVGQHKTYIYKIGIVNQDGKIVYLTDQQIKEFCDKNGLLYSDTFFYYGTVYNHFFSLGLAEYYDDSDWRDHYIKALEDLYNEKDCYMCKNAVPEEGIVIRIEHLENYEAYKLKSKRFIKYESDQQEQEISNMEDEN